uniref:isochorismate synthase n=2 Tax=Auxenochlorella protothecoides TaxID=3075 RepID=A0A1D2A6W6_AUXPR
MSSPGPAGFSPARGLQPGHTRLAEGPDAHLLHHNARRCQRSHRSAQYRAPCRPITSQASPASSSLYEAVAPHPSRGPPSSDPAEAPQPMPAPSPPPPPVHVHCQTLPPCKDLAAGKEQVEKALDAAVAARAGLPAALIRCEAQVPRTHSALAWLQAQRAGTSGAAAPSRPAPTLYFSPRLSPGPDSAGAAAAACEEGAGAVAGVGAAALWRGAPGEALDAARLHGMQRFTSAAAPRVRALGGSRFDAQRGLSPEWAAFGTFTFLIPSVEVTDVGGALLLACTACWDSKAAPGAGPSATDAGAALATALTTLRDVRGAAAPPSLAAFAGGRGAVSHSPRRAEWEAAVTLAQELLDEESAEGEAAPCTPSLLDPGTALENYIAGGQQGLDDLLEALEGTPALGAPATGGDCGTRDPDCGAAALSKVVLARRSELRLSGGADPLALLASLQARNPRAYALFLELEGGEAFLSCTPERLYSRSGRSVASEAVAGTRARGGGSVENDFWLALDLLQSKKEHAEFTIVRDWVYEALRGICATVRVDVRKTVLKQESLQHLYGQLSGTLLPAATDADLLAALHPTPAVCGRPREASRDMLSSLEPFDRGFYSGPFGWLGGQGAEFAVAIRSALFVPEVQAPEFPGVQALGPTAMRVALYAGVGIVPGSKASLEWAELDLKVAALDRLLTPVPALQQAPNLNAAYARILVEELCRLGCSTFCIAPGSRSSPLTLAAAQHPRVQLVSGMDERSLAFWALGHGRSGAAPAVILTTSGTAVANLLPAAVEGWQSGTPLIILTADRPAEVRGSGANQTIHQPGIFSSYVCWQADLAPPSSAMPPQHLLGSLDRAVAAAGAGPVHLNVQLREPLGPVPEPWESTAWLEGLGDWATSSRPWSVQLEAAACASRLPHSLLAALSTATRGLLVAGELRAPEDRAAALAVSRALRWPLLADVLSGLRVGATGVPEGLIACGDNILAAQDPGMCTALRPDVVLQLGGRLTSKRISAFLAASSARGSSAGNDSAAWWVVDASPHSFDEHGCLAGRVRLPLGALERLLREAGVLVEGAAAAPFTSPYLELWRTMDREVGFLVRQRLNSAPYGEAHIAACLASSLPRGHALYIGNSMPIRDMDMFADGLALSGCTQGQVPSLGCPVGANRGASGIDGVLSSAAGFASGLGMPTTLVVGDLSFLHDTNGLMLLRSGPARSPLTVVVINNGGGGIFSSLPIAGQVPAQTLSDGWTTPQAVELGGLCRAHGVPHLRLGLADGTQALRAALRAAWASHTHSVVEVAVDPAGNLDWHRATTAAAAKLAEGVWGAEVRRRRMGDVQSMAPATNGAVGEGRHVPSLGRAVIAQAWYERCSAPLSQPLPVRGGAPQDCRRVLRLHLRLSSGACGMGEAAPLAGVHAESLEESEAQLAGLCALLPGVGMPQTLARLGGRVADWLEREVGVLPRTLHPSVRCALEFALLGALAQEGQQTLSQLLCAELAGPHLSGPLPNNALLDCGEQTVAKAAEAAKKLVLQGWRAIKIKVGRRANPELDAAVVCGVRSAVGSEVVLRADANRAWSLPQAVQFGKAAARAKLQYIEEPVQDWQDLESFWRATGIATALDESVTQEGILDPPPEGTVALVLKPGVMGGPEATFELARTAARLGLQVALSSCMETREGLALLRELARAVDVQVFPDMLGLHGLGTDGYVGEAVAEPGSRPGGDLPSSARSPEGDRRPRATGSDLQGCAGLAIHCRRVLRHGCESEGGAAGTLVLLHGFLGAAEDWTPVAASLGTRRTVLAPDLPGHGSAGLLTGMVPPSLEQAAADVAGWCATLQQPVTLVGYSLGARLALTLALRHPGACSRLVLVSGSPGLEDALARAQRASQDAALATTMRQAPIEVFLEHWYSQPMWGTLRRHPRQSGIVARRASAQSDHAALADVLEAWSPGRASHAWDELPALSRRMPILLITGEEDEKFVGLQQAMLQRCQPAGTSGIGVQAATILSAGHAVHLERPLELAGAIEAWLKGLECTQQTLRPLE